MIAAHPLQWPEGWPRTDYFKKKYGKFNKKERRPGSNWASARDVTVAEACSRVLDELDRMGIDRQDVVISTNVRTRLDGLPRSGEREPDDGGAAVYWQTKKGERRVMAIDQYLSVADNLAAIAATLDAMRAIERHGGAQILDRAFTGFTALPEPRRARHWREVIGVPQWETSLSEVRAIYRRRAMELHPDRPGGSHNAMAELNAALSAAERELA